ncbi:hypothetical protein RSOL_289920 [Rhizoctonia solani AG-3 Rhs1AP]|uniref:Zn-finger protein n=1 Tax=Rhizoctonia solani AG-3 Rhs1AP TaxID=1086054 RepID=A0A0A1UKQ1_9AGAM|nr:hypothetical protein RSOL_289920 [Rhizoctonia solani AG-3 Rhs1AP]
MLGDLDKLPHGPNWEMYEIEIKQADGKFRVEYLFGCNIIEVIQSLIGDWTFRDELRYSPTRVWTTKNRKERVFGEAWTGNWWWRIQARFTIMMIPDKFATIVPLIIATDKTQLSVMCGGQEAYPVYLTIGNIPKSVRRKIGRHATVLLGYLPVDEFTEVADPDERARLKHQLTHDALGLLLEPLRRAAKEGVVMTCADGRQRRIYPIPAAFEGDWPEQCGMACAEEGGCPVCEQVYDQRSNYPNLAPRRDPNDTITALRAYFANKEDPGELKPLRLKPWWPWWASMPFVNFHASIMPDLLHQLYQGMLKTHVITWSKKVIGAHLVDKCFRAMPGAVGLRHFTKGISRIPGSRWTGRESKETAKQLLTVVAGQKSIQPGFVSLVRSMLDFTYRAHKSQMSESDLQGLERALGEFHEKKPVLVALGIHNSPKRLNRVKKLHMLTHYYLAICEMGTPDGYNTELPEHLHIIYAKRGWRASNKVCPLPQMAKFIQRYEAIRIHRMYIDMYYGCPVQDWRESRVVYGEDEDAISEGVGRKLANEAEEQDDGWVEKWSIAAKPTILRMTCDRIIDKYGACDFISRTNEWLQESTEVGLLPPLQFVTHDHTFDIWHKFYLHHRPLYFDPDLPARRDTIRAQPPLPVPDNSLRSIGPGRFDCVLFLAKPQEFGIHRYRAGRVRLIFKLPPHLSTIYPHPLVYLELFTSFSKELSRTHRMHTISHDMHRGTRRTIVMPLVWVVAACHLVPLFSQFEEGFPFDCYDVLSTGKELFFNHYSSNFMFSLVDHWRMVQQKAAEAKAVERRAAEDEERHARAARGKVARARLVQIRAEMNSDSH